MLSQFTKRMVLAQTRGNFLGLFWMLITPLLSLGLYSVVFGLIMGGQFRSGDDVGRFEFPLGIFTGMILINLINENMAVSPTLMTAHRNLVQKVVFPLEVLPVANAASILVKHLASALLLFLGVILIGPGASPTMLAYPIVVLPVFMIALGVSWGLSAIGVYFRDTRQLVSFFSMALFYASGVFFPKSIVPPEIYLYLRFNPLLQAIDQMREVMLWHHAPDWRIIACLYLAAFIVIACGYLAFQKLRRGFADVL